MDIRETRKQRISQKELLNNQQINVSSINDSLIYNLLRKFDLQAEILDKYSIEHQRVKQIKLTTKVHSPWVLLGAICCMIPPLMKRKLKVSYALGCFCVLMGFNELDKQRVAMTLFKDLADEYKEAKLNYNLMVNAKIKMHSFFANNGLGFDNIRESDKTNYLRYRVF